MKSKHLDVKVIIHRFQCNEEFKYDLDLRYRISPRSDFLSVDRTKIVSVKELSAYFSRKLNASKIPQFKFLYFDWESRIYLHSFDTVEEFTVSLSRITGLSGDEVNYVVDKLHKTVNSLSYFENSLTLVVDDILT